MGILTDDYNGNLLKDINVSEENGVYQVPIDYKILKTINSYRSFQADDVKNVSLNKDIISNSNNHNSFMKNYFGKTNDAISSAIDAAKVGLSSAEIFYLAKGVKSDVLTKLMLRLVFWRHGMMWEK